MFQLSAHVLDSDYRIVGCDGSTVDLATVAMWFADYGIDRFMVCMDGHIAQVDVSLHPEAGNRLQITARREDTGEPIVSIKYFLSPTVSQARIDSAQQMSIHADYITRYACEPNKYNVDSIAYHALCIATLLDKMPAK